MPVLPCPMKAARSLYQVLFACLVVSCAELRPLTAPHADYADYRATRVATSIPLRIAAAAAYLERHPEGAWREEVASWFETAEAIFYEQCRNSPQGVER